MTTAPTDQTHTHTQHKLTLPQLETDTGKSKTETGEEDEEALGSSVNIDYNRAGAPLIEIVFEPDITSPEDAGEAVSTLQRLLKHVGVCDGKFELGSLRCDLNVSIFEGKDGDLIPPIEKVSEKASSPRCAFTS